MKSQLILISYRMPVPCWIFFMWNAVLNKHYYFYISQKKGVISKCYVAKVVNPTHVFCPPWKFCDFVLPPVLLQRRIIILDSRYVWNIWLLTRIWCRVSDGWKVNQKHSGNLLGNMRFYIDHIVAQNFEMKKQYLKT